MYGAERPRIISGPCSQLLVTTADRAFIADAKPVAMKKMGFVEGRKKVGVGSENSQAPFSCTDYVCDTLCQSSLNSLDAEGCLWQPARKRDWPEIKGIRFK